MRRWTGPPRFRTWRRSPLCSNAPELRRSITIGLPANPLGSPARSRSTKPHVCSVSNCPRRGRQATTPSIPRAGAIKSKPDASTRMGYANRSGSARSSSRTPGTRSCSSSWTLSFELLESGKLNEKPLQRPSLHLGAKQGTSAALSQSASSRVSVGCSWGPDAS
jgi:hypothetical protein